MRDAERPEIDPRTGATKRPDAPIAFNLPGPLPARPVAATKPKRKRAEKPPHGIAALEDPLDEFSSTPPLEGPPPPEEPDDAEGDAGPCPVTALGSRDGVYWFSSARGELHALKAHEINGRAGIVRLFDGETEWLRQRFPSYNAKGEPTGGWRIADAAEWLVKQCAFKPLWDDAVAQRGRGVWPAGSASEPKPGVIVHCGDAVSVDGGQWQPPGFKHKGSIYRAMPPIARPDFAPACTEVCAGLVTALGLWNWAHENAPVVVAGWLAAAFLGAAKPWNPHLLVVAEPGAGKTALAALIETVSVLALVFDDFTPAGLRQALTGEARPIVLDEAEGSEGRRGERGPVEMAIEMIRRLSSEKGLRAVRGSAEGAAQRFNATGQACLLAVLPPDLKPQDRSRITRLDLNPLPPHADPQELRAAIEGLAEIAVAVWSRMIRLRPVYLANYATIRQALGELGCSPRQQDQPGAILAGAATLEHDEPIAFEEAWRLVKACAFIVHAGEDETEGGPRRSLDQLMASQPDGYASGHRRTMGQILDLIREGHSDLNDVLNAHGIRVARGPANEFLGIYVAARFPALSRFYAGTPWANGGWIDDLRRLPGVTEPPNPMRIGGAKPRVVFVPASLLPEPEETKPAKDEKSKEEKSGADPPAKGEPA